MAGEKYNLIKAILIGYPAEKDKFKKVYYDEGEIELMTCKGFDND